MEKTEDGVLVGTDEGTGVMLNPTDGKVLWTCLLEKNGEINRFHGESEEGFLVSDHQGKLLMGCLDQCVPR